MEFARNVLASLWAAVRAVRVWLLAWTIVTAAAVLVVWPAWRVLDEGLSQHPGAGYHLDQALDVDLWRTRPELALSIGGALLFALLAGIYLAGGVLTTVGREDRRFRFAQLLGEGGYLFLRNLRVIAIGLVLAVGIGWGFAQLDAWLLEDVLYATEPGAIAVRLGIADLRWIHVLEAIAWTKGLCVVGLLFASKVAMARLADGPRRSALIAWGTAIGRLLRRPFRAVGIVVLWTAIWAGGSQLIGELTAYLLEVRQELLLGALAGQVGIVLGQWVLIGLLLSARRFLGPPVPALVVAGD